MSAASAITIEPFSLRRTRKYSSSRPIANSSYPCSSARATTFPQDRARAVRPFLALDGHVAGEPREAWLPGDGREAVEIRDGGDVGVARHLTELTGREPGSGRTVGDQPIEVLYRNELRAGPAVEIHELGEEELDSPLLHGPANFADLRTSVATLTPSSFVVGNRR